MFHIFLCVTQIWRPRVGTKKRKEPEDEGKKKKRNRNSQHVEGFPHLERSDSSSCTHAKRMFSIIIRERVECGPTRRETEHTDIIWMCSSCTAFFFSIIISCLISEILFCSTKVGPQKVISIQLAERKWIDNALCNFFNSPRCAATRTDQSNVHSQFFFLTDYLTKACLCDSTTVHIIINK